MNDEHLSAREATFNTVVCLAASTWLGFADFALFSLFGADGHLNVFGLIKVSSWGPSYLLIQLAAFAAAGLAASIGFLILEPTRQFFLPRLLPVRIAPLAVALIATLIMVLRFVKSGGFSLRLAVLGCLSLVTVVMVTFIARVIRDFGDLQPWRKRILVLSAALLFPFSVAFFVSELSLPLFASPSDQPRGGDSRPNVLFVVLDTVRADSLGCSNRQTDSTPAINGFAREGVLFENAFASAPWTVPSHASMFTGLHTGVHQAEWGNTVLDGEFVTLAEILSAEGYRTAGFSENPFIGSSTQMSQGFSTFFEAWRRPMLVRALSRMAAQVGLFEERREYAEHNLAMFQRWHRDTSNTGRPFFAYMNFMAAHLPRYPRSQIYDETVLEKIQPVNLVPEKFYLPDYRLADRDLSVMRSIYREEIEYLDGIIGRLREYLRDEGVLDQTIIILTSDHGENFGEHGLIEHQFCLYNQLIHVPLILWYPPTLAPRNVEENVSTIAIPATVSELVGLDIREVAPQAWHQPLHLVTQDQAVVAESVSGAGMLRDVLEHLAPNFDFAEFDRNMSCVIAGDRKLIVDSEGHEELYDLSSDPGEERNIAPTEPDVVRLLSSIYVSPLISNKHDQGSTTGIELDPDTLDALRALGYLR